jgi:hypothetical protein
LLRQGNPTLNETNSTVESISIAQNNIRYWSRIMKETKLFTVVFVSVVILFVIGGVVVATRQTHSQSTTPSAAMTDSMTKTMSGSTTGSMTGSMNDKTTAQPGMMADPGKRM